MASKSISRRNAFSITWIIENFDHCWPREKAIHSPTFVVALMESTKWHLVIYPWNNGYVSFYIARLADCEGPENIEVNFQLEFLSSDGSTLKFKNRENCSFSKDKSFGMDEFATTKEVFEINEHDFLPHGNLTARCTTWKSIGEIYKNVACLARTIIGVKRRSALWEIDHDSFKEWKTKNHNQMKSAFEDDINLSMIFDLRKGLGNREEIYIELVPNFSDSIYMTCKGSLMDATGNIIECKETKFHFNDMFKTRCFSLNISKEELMNNKELYFPNNLLNLHVEYSYSTKILYQEIEIFGISQDINQDEKYHFIFGARNEQPETFNTLKDNLSSLYSESFLSDVKLKTNTSTHPAHKAVLSARSPVFKTMFQTEMREKISQCVELPDLDEETIRLMLQFMYTADLKELRWNSACQLYEAADKYEILSLKKICSSFLLSNLSVANACELLDLFDMHQDADQKLAVQEFILKRDAEVFNSDEWKLFIETNTKLAADTMVLKYKT